MLVTHVGVGVSITIRVGQNQHVNVHGVQKGGEGGVGTVISGDLNRNKRTECCRMAHLKKNNNESNLSHYV